MAERPSGTITFLFTDIEGSTALWENEPEAMKAALAHHDAILRDSIESNAGHIVKSTGDGVLAVFDGGLDALNASIVAQRQLQDPLGNLSIRVRMGLHTGEAEVRNGDYFGSVLNRAARLMSAANGGQILISNATADLIGHKLPEPMALRDLGEHRFKGLTRLDRVFQLLHPDLPADFPPIASLDSYPNNLPVQLTSFVGRTRELAEAREKLAATHLLTLIGPGGTGKTRLSLQLGADLLPEFADGAWLVELAPLADPALIMQTVAGALGVHEQIGMPLEEAVLNYVRAKKLLLILDNCEHLVEASAQLAEHLLHASPGMKIVASSREALGISGETIYRVPSLSLTNEAVATPEVLQSCEAALLFIDRAQAVNPRFVLMDQNAPAIAQICRRLDGIPLALELAASRVAVFSAEQIASRLDDRFKLLTGGSRTALPRQQTLRALIDWSYDILSDPERNLLRRLAVFAGGWTFEAAEAIGGELDVMDLLTQLVNKSLVVMDDENGMPRYRMLETIRQYSRDKLLDLGESQAARKQHLDYFIQFAETEAPRIDIFKQAVDALERLDTEHDNFRAALEWGLENDVEAALHLVNVLATYWFRRGHAVEGSQWINEVLAKAETLPRADGDAGVQRIKPLANIWGSLMFLCYSQGDNAKAYAASQKCIPLARESGDMRQLGMALGFGGSALLFLGRSDEAASLIEEAEAIARKHTDLYGLGVTFGLVAQYYAIARHDFKAAAAYEDEGISILEANAPGSWAARMALFASARSALMRQDFDTARERFEKCRPAFIQMGDLHRAAMIDSELAHIERHKGNYQQAEEAYRKTLLVWQKLGHRAAIAHELECLAFIAKVKERGERAAQLLAAADALRRTINIDMSPVERVEYDRELAELKAGMDEDTFARAQSAGRAMSMEDAIVLALQEG